MVVGVPPMGEGSPLNTINSNDPFTNSI
jgi:hypothetical protein